MGHLLQNGRDVGENTKQRNRRERAHREHQLHLGPNYGVKFMLEMNPLRRLVGHQTKQSDTGDEANGNDGPKGESPSERLAQSGSGRNPKYIRQREPAEHNRDCLGALGTWDQVRRYDASYAKEGSMAKRGKN